MWDLLASEQGDGRSPQGTVGSSTGAVGAERSGLVTARLSLLSQYKKNTLSVPRAMGLPSSSVPRGGCLLLEGKVDKWGFSEGRACAGTGCP